MARTRRARAWWTNTVERWRQSGLGAREFARREGVSAASLWWWSSQLGRGTRAKRGSTSPVALEVQLTEAVTAQASGMLQVEALGAVIRLPAGTEPAYVAALVRSLAGR